MEVGTNLERLDRQQLVDLLEEHHAALRMSAPCHMPVASATLRTEAVGFGNQRMLTLHENSLNSNLKHMNYPILNLC